MTGCESTTQKTLTYTRTATIADGVKIDLSYKVTYTDKYVDVVETTEKIIADDTDYLDLYKEQIEKLYSPYKDIQYYTYNVDVSGDTLTSTTKIDYKNIDTNAMIEIDSANATLIKDGKISISDIQSVYENLGATCQ